ncbi:MAG: thymidine phosphorylase [Firmicutes bacterium]|nr:thymidine phosphorylase [Bacillota bacterium]
MRAIDIIRQKRDGATLSDEAVRFFVHRYTAGEIPDYQAAAWLMAVYLRGMEERETKALTRALVDSGAQLEFSLPGRTVVDKHSTGGVGDKTTLVLMPLLAAAGVTLAKMSGQGLGHTGGTIDKLSCIPGFRAELTREEFTRQVAETGLAITGQSPEMVPADGKLYALRDVTATVDSIPLIAASVMSKKIAAGAQSLLLDVKVGSGSFLRSLPEAKTLAGLMVSIGKSLGRRTVALVTAMEQPLGLTVGNHLEVIEALQTLRGAGPPDLRDLCLHLGAEMLLLAGVERDFGAARQRVASCLADGTALQAMRRFIAVQGGDARIVDDPDRLGIPRAKGELLANGNGCVTRLDARTVGDTAVSLGAGREKKGESIDLLAGIRLYKKCGDAVCRGELLAELFSSRPETIAPATALLESAYLFGDSAPPAGPLVLERVE